MQALNVGRDSDGLLTVRGDSGLFLAKQCYFVVDAKPFKLLDCVVEQRVDIPRRDRNQCNLGGKPLQPLILRPSLEIATPQINIGLPAESSSL